MIPNVAQVIVESPIPRLDRLLDYRVPEHLAQDLVIGGRVSVPLGRGRLVTGFVVGVSEAAPPGVELADIDALLGSVPVLTPQLWTTIRSLADRNCGGAADIIRTAIPRRAVRVEKGRHIAPRVVGTSEPGRRLALSLDHGVVDTPTGPTLRAWAQLTELVSNTRGGVIVVVPDWRDVALISRSFATIPHSTWDSSGTPSQRYARYLDVLSGETRVVIGTRSAVYAPVENLELLVVVSESDPLLEEPHAPYVHARDAAIVRNGVEGGTLLFASLTPSAEVARFIDMGFVESPTNNARRNHVVLANDTSGEGHASRARIPSSAWKLVRSALESGPVLIQVARPGFSPLVTCVACRNPHRCPQCRNPLSGTRDGVVHCRACGAKPLGLRCAQCGGRQLSWAGVGSVRTAVELGRAFPGVLVVLADGEHRQLEVPRKPSLVVATRGAEPIVQGGYDAVLIVDGDRELSRPSLRASEDCLRWWGNAASLAGDDAHVIVANIEGAFATHFATRQWERIVEAELTELRALGFPPATRAITVRGSIVELEAVRSIPDIASHRILGPVPDSNNHRMTLLVEYRYAQAVITALRAYIVGQSATTLRVHCDDPTAFDAIDDD